MTGPARRRRVARRPAGPPTVDATTVEPVTAQPVTPQADAAEPAPPPADSGADHRSRRRARATERAATEDQQNRAAERPARRRPNERGDNDRALRSLVSTRGTQLTADAALRAREYGAPGPAELAEAERELVIVRRNYVPPAPLATGRRSGTGRRDGQAKR